MLLYKIQFEVDNGFYYDKDVALVMAHDKEEAIEKLRQMINAINSETCVSMIFDVSVFDGDVFTGNHGCK